MRLARQAGPAEDGRLVLAVDFVALADSHENYGAFLYAVNNTIVQEAFAVEKQLSVQRLSKKRVFQNFIDSFAHNFSDRTVKLSSRRLEFVGVEGFKLHASAPQDYRRT